jgi:hypothetical protein
VYVNDELLSSTTAVDGVWSVEDKLPTEAMRGTGTVEARVAGAATASAVVTVYALPETGLVATMLGSLGVATASGTVDDDLSTWSKAGLTVGGDSSGYTLNAAGTGEATRRINDTATGETPHRMSLSATVSSGTSEWVRFVVGGKAAWIHLTNGEVGASSTVDTTPVVVVSGVGTWDITVIQEITSASGVLIAPADGDGASKATSTIDGETMLTVKDVVFEQTRVVDWTSQQPLTPVASQASAESQPGYDDATLSFDGDDDYLTFASSLTSSAALTILFLAQRSGPGSSAANFLIDSGTGSGGNRLSFGIFNGNLIWYDTGVKGAAEAIGSGYHLVGLVLDGAGGGEIRKDGAVVDTDASSNHALDETVALGARNDGGAAWWEGPVAAGVIYSRMLTGNDLTYAEEFLTAYGQSIGVL